MAFGFGASVAQKHMRTQQTMEGVLDIKLTSENSTVQACALDEQDAELAREVDKGINEAKEAISEKLADGRLQAKRLLKHGKYAIEDGVSELAHRIRKNPLSFLGIAFAVGAACGLLLALPSQPQRRNTD